MWAYILQSQKEADVSHVSDNNISNNIMQLFGEGMQFYYELEGALASTGL